jgi:hypothetical protein
MSLVSNNRVIKSAYETALWFAYMEYFAEHGAIPQFIGA